MSAKSCADDLSLGFLVHRLLSCSQAEERREFLCENDDIRCQLFAALQAAGGFQRGRIKHCADDRRVVHLVACLALLTASEGTAAQAKLVKHCARYADAYLTLLVPHAGDARVAALLRLLAGCGGHEDLLPDAAAAPDHLRLLVSLAARLSGDITSGTAGSRRSSTGGSGDGSTHGAVLGLGGEEAPHGPLADLLAACFISVVDVVAGVEAELRQEAGRKPAAEGRAGGFGNKVQPSPEQLQQQVEKFVRASLPLDGIRAALGVLRSFAPRHMAGLLRHTHVHSSPLVVSMLQLDLLTGRLPAGKPCTLAALGSVVQHGQVLAAALRAGLTTLFSDGSRQHMVGVLHLLSTSKAALRCLAVAARCNLSFAEGPAAAQQTAGFVRALLCSRDGGRGPAGDSPTGLDLLWHLAARQPGVCWPAARRACDVLKWCLAPPLPELRDLLAQHVPAGLLVDELAGQLQLERGTVVLSNESSPFLLELGQALLESAAFRADAGSGACSASLDRLRQLLEADKLSMNRWSASARASEGAAVAGAGAAGPGPRKSALDSLGKGADLDALDGFMPPARAPAAPAQQQVPAAQAAPTDAPTAAANPHSSLGVAAAPGSPQREAAPAPCTPPRVLPDAAAGTAPPTSAGAAGLSAEKRLELLKRQLQLRQEQKKAASAAGAGAASAGAGAASAAPAMAAPAGAGAVPSSHASPSTLCSSAHSSVTPGASDSISSDVAAGNSVGADGDSTPCQDRAELRYDSHLWRVERFPGALTARHGSIAGEAGASAGRQRQPGGQSGPVQRDGGPGGASQPRSPQPPEQPRFSSQAGHAPSVPSPASPGSPQQAAARAETFEVAAQRMAQLAASSVEGLAGSPGQRGPTAEPLHAQAPSGRPPPGSCAEDQQAAPAWLYGELVHTPNPAAATEPRSDQYAAGGAEPMLVDLTANLPWRGVPHEQHGGPPSAHQCGSSPGGAPADDPGLQGGMTRPAQHRAGPFGAAHTAASPPLFVPAGFAVWQAPADEPRGHRFPSSSGSSGTAPHGTAPAAHTERLFPFSHDGQAAAAPVAAGSTACPGAEAGAEPPSHRSEAEHMDVDDDQADMEE